MTLADRNDVDIIRKRHRFEAIIDSDTAGDHSKFAKTSLDSAEKESGKLRSAIID